MTKSPSLAFRAAASASGVPVRGVWHLLFLVLGPGPDAGHENLEYPRRGSPGTAADAVAGPGQVRAELALVPAAPGSYCAFQAVGRRIGGDRSGLGDGLGTAQPIPSTAAIPA